MPRLFVAIDITGETRDRVAAEQRRLRAGAGDALRLVKAEQLHVTLAFMAAVEPSRVDALAGAIQRGFRHPAFDLGFSGLGVLPGLRNPRVLYVGLTEGGDALTALQRLVADRLAEHGLDRNERPFRPHLTLARWRDPRAADARKLLESASRMVFIEHVARVTLYESRLASNGATHTAVAQGALGLPAAESSTRS